MTETRSTVRNGAGVRRPATAVITCSVLEDEIAHYAKGLEHLVHIELMEQGLHNEPDRLRLEVQEAIDRVERQRDDVEAIVLGYGVCSRGTEGVFTRRCKLVIARAHDCLTLLLGGKERYAKYVEEHPGTYWYSPGWNKHHTPPGQQRHEKLYRQYVEKYGKDNADYLMESEQHWFNTYDRATFVDLGAGDVDGQREYTQQCADWLDWSFDHQRGDPRLLRALLEGDWNEQDFVVLEPGQTIRLTGDGRVIEAVDLST